MKLSWEAFEEGVKTKVYVLEKAELEHEKLGR
jgi:hypothetical protein